MRLPEYGRNPHTRKAYVQQPNLLMVGVDVSKAKHHACLGTQRGISRRKLAFAHTREGMSVLNRPSSNSASSMPVGTSSSLWSPLVSTGRPSTTDSKGVTMGFAWDTAKPCGTIARLCRRAQVKLMKKMPTSVFCCGRGSVFARRTRP